MVAAADARDHARKLGVTRSMVVQELGWDEDTDDDIRAAVEEAIGSAMVDDETDAVVAAVLLWWREGDGDLADELGLIGERLPDDGFVWVLNPMTGKPGFVDHGEIAEAAEAAGLTRTRTVALGAWSGSRLVGPRTSS
ncbi:DUF3052 domain-containing protein [Streptomyces sp. RerS4]|uniref:DUF3052 domain-containing protein n=1 Tax=Streptomyces sp. RerS4 TaxID=2942449 RepID=UPI00201BC75D|nr:DUF3052 domain-containing protein [Streptomyces sp. RerS4]UQX04496.1 DUF3052 domain-containing protein [Streptomyces sp. RerS4]